MDKAMPAGLVLVIIISELPKNYLNKQHSTAHTCYRLLPSLLNQVCLSVTSTTSGYFLSNDEHKKCRQQKVLGHLMECSQLECENTWHSEVDSVRKFKRENN